MERANYPYRRARTTPDRVGGDPVAARCGANSRGGEERMTSDEPGGPAVECRVRYSETDQMGVVYHANYLIWCEMARTNLIRIRGRSYADLEREGLFLAVADASIRYHAPARYDDLVRTEAWVEEIRSRTVTFGYRVSRTTVSGDRQRLAMAKTTLVALDRDSRPRKLPADLVEVLRSG